MKKQKLAKELSDLVTHCKSIRFEDFQVSIQKRKLKYWIKCNKYDNVYIKVICIRQ